MLRKLKIKNYKKQKFLNLEHYKKKILWNQRKVLIFYKLMILVNQHNNILTIYIIN